MSFREMEATDGLEVEGAMSIEDIARRENLKVELVTRFQGKRLTGDKSRDQCGLKRGS